ncbi:PNC2 [Symbiodinium pilosum]|uniref:PNC2 protein n=1 Tax=Symbiodinium pilosum TaxID=2952 RepID=A0A812J0X9_SYMPI|nr:PNC2 [Symbiodinium pilosum]
MADGPLGLWLGAGGKCTENGAKNFAYFYIYDGMNAVVKQYMAVTTGVKLVLGYVAGVGNTLINMPLEVISTKMQLDDAKGLGTVGMLRRIIQEEGLGALYTGLGYNIALCINPAIQNTILDKLKEALLQQMKRRNPEVAPALTAFQAFTLGAFAKAVATVVTYPLVRLKTNLQAGKVPQPTAERQPSVRSMQPNLPRITSKGMTRSGSIEMIRAMSFREDREPTSVSLFQRLIELYRGVYSALLKSTLQSALLYMVKDQVEFSVERFFHLTAQVFFRKSGQVKLGSFSGRPLAS